jgi:hypothetical protein
LPTGEPQQETHPQVVNGRVTVHHGLDRGQAALPLKAVLGLHLEARVVRVRVRAEVPDRERGAPVVEEVPSLALVNR